MFTLNHSGTTVPALLSKCASVAARYGANRHCGGKITTRRRWTTGGPPSKEECGSRRRETQDVTVTLVRCGVRELRCGIWT